MFVDVKYQYSEVLVLKMILNSHSISDRIFHGIFLEIHMEKKIQKNSKNSDER